MFLYVLCILTFFLLCCGLKPAMASSSLRILDQARRSTTVGRTSLDEWSVRRRDLYLKTLRTHKRRTLPTPGGIRTHNPSKRVAADPRLRPCGHWDRQCTYFSINHNNSAVRCLRRLLSSMCGKCCDWVRVVVLWYLSLIERCAEARI